MNVVKRYEEPIFKKGTRTQGHWVELVKESNKVYLIGYGDERGEIKTTEVDNEDDANTIFNDTKISITATEYRRI